jgi:hypothetical protein
VIALSAEGLSANRVAATIKRNRRTVQKFLDEPGTKEALDAILERLCRKTLDGITDESIEKSSFLQRITSAAIMIDKMRLIRNEPTTIHVEYLLDAVQAIKEMRAAGNPRPQLPPVRDQKES